MDWLLSTACADYDTIELDSAITGKAQRKQYKALRDQKRNVEKMVTALQAYSKQLNRRKARNCARSLKPKWRSIRRDMMAPAQ